MKQYLHGAEYNIGNDHIVCVCEYNTDIKDTTLKFYKNPKRKIWVTKPSLRTHSCIKESVPKAEVDEYVTTQNNMVRVVNKAIYGNPYRPMQSNFQVNRNPYTYGTDVAMLTLIKRNYIKNCGDIPFNLKLGALDIETSVVTGEIINVSYTDMATRTSYVSYNTKILAEPQQKNHCKSENEVLEYCTRIVDDYVKGINPKIRDKVNTDYKIVVGGFETELDLLLWTMNKINHCKPEFCIIWNINYDIPYILDRMERLGVLPETVFCHSDVPEEYRYLKYKEDTHEVEHFTDAWHVLECTGYTKYLDSMCMYSRLRKVYGRKDSYKLEDVLQEELGIGKLEIIPGATHGYLQKNRYLDYCAYNILDTLLLCIVEDKNHDVESMLGLIGISPLWACAQQTTMLKNTFYDYCMGVGLVPGSTSGKNLPPYKDLLGPKLGGGVLSPNLAVSVGSNILEDCPNVPTKLCKFVLDLDVKSMYPTLDVVFGVSRETTIADVLSIEGFEFEDVNTFFSNVCSPKENAVMLCNKYLGLPEYDDIEKFIDL